VIKEEFNSLYDKNKCEMIFCGIRSSSSNATIYAIYRCNLPFIACPSSMYVIVMLQNIVTKEIDKKS
jgi:adenosine deaminase